MSFLAHSLKPYTPPSPRPFRTASLSYLTIYSPLLRRDDAPSESTSSELSQILFYTCRAHTVTQNAMLRQIGIAKGLVDFSCQFSASRSLVVHSSKRRLILLELQEGLWAHAAIDMNDAYLPDEWIEASIRAAWRDWRLLHGNPKGRKAWERALEKYWSVWVWSWDLEAPEKVLEETVGGVPIVPAGPRDKLSMLMNAWKREGTEVILLKETDLLWPPSDAGCLDAEQETTTADDTSRFLTALDRTDILRRVVTHLTGLERERELVRVASAGNGRRKGTPDAIREKSSKHNPRADTTSKTPSSSSAKRIEGGTSTPWSSWGGMFASIGKGLTASRPASPQKPVESKSKPYGNGNVNTPHGKQASGPFQALQQRLAQAMPIQDAGGRVWSGAESAWKAIGLASSVSSEGQGPSPPAMKTNVDLNELAKAMDDADLSTTIDSQPVRADPLSQQPERATAEAQNHETNHDSPRTAKGAAAEAIKAFPSISGTSAAWYTSQPLKSQPSAPTTSKPPSEAGTDGGGSRHSVETTVEPTSLPDSRSALASIHHNFELDGWGDEEPVPFQSFRCFVGGGDGPFSLDQQEDVVELEVGFTTRRLLTLVVISRVDKSQPCLLKPGWELVRRIQRVINDHERLSCASEEHPCQFLHLDKATLTYQKRLSAESWLGHCLSARSVMQRHGIRETLARSNDGKTWTAARDGNTFMVLPGKNVSIVDCDNELRKLANEFPSFGI